MKGREGEGGIAEEWKRHLARIMLNDRHKTHRWSVVCRGDCVGIPAALYTPAFELCNKLGVALSTTGGNRTFHAIGVPRHAPRAVPQIIHAT